jgi:hypothetical protein
MQINLGCMGGAHKSNKVRDRNLLHIAPAAQFSSKIIWQDHSGLRLLRDSTSNPQAKIINIYKDYK